MHAADDVEPEPHGFDDDLYPVGFESAAHRSNPNEQASRAQLLCRLEGEVGQAGVGFAFGQAELAAASVTAPVGNTGCSLGLGKSQSIAEEEKIRCL